MKGDKTNAEIRRRLLQLGLVTTDEVIAWADALIADRPAPPPWALELAMAMSPADAVHHLGSVPGEHDRRQVWAALAARWLGEVDVASPARLSAIARELYDAALRGDVPYRGAANEMMHFWDAIDLAREGVSGAVELEVIAMRDFFERCIANAAAQHHDED